MSTTDGILEASGIIHRAIDQRLMAKMDTIKISHGHDGPLKFRSMCDQGGGQSAFYGKSFITGEELDSARETRCSAATQIAIAKVQALQP